MIYYITKDCGAGWDDDAATENSLEGWGVSRSQETLARKPESGDVLLHYIDHVQAWSGYSEVTGALIGNNRDKDNDWRKALPWILPVRRGVYLSRRQCQLTRALSGVSDRHRQRAFSKIPEEEARVVIEAIENAAMSAVKAEDPVFSAAWEQGADNYYGDIRKAIASHKCEACGADGITWANKHLGGRLRKGDDVADTDWFLEAAHIIPRHKNGRATPDNLIALCRNCHHLIDRLPHEEKVAYLRSLGAMSC
jgi:hypothetical protein